MSSGDPVKQLESTAQRAQVTFLLDRGAILSAGITQIDDTAPEEHGINVWSTADWSLLRSFHAPGVVPRLVGKVGSTEYAAILERDGRLEVFDLETSSLRWSVPLVGPDYRVSTADRPPDVGRLVLDPGGRFIITYEGPLSSIPRQIDRDYGTLVIRDADGAVIAAYDIPELGGLAVAPDGRSFLFSVGARKTYTALARMPF